VFLPFDPLIRVRLLGMRLATRASCLLVLAVVFGGVVSRLDDELTTQFGRLGISLTAAICTAVVLLVLVIHEAGRQAVSRRLGVRVRRADLYLFGSAAESVDDTTSPRSDLLTGAAGLVILALIAAGFSVLAFLTRSAPDWLHVSVKALAVGLGALALLQVAPALPLDGGKFFRALVWYLTDDSLTGVKGAAFYAQLHGAALIAIGIVLLGAEGALPFWGAAALVAGLQLGTAARASVHRSTWQRLSQSVLVRDAIGRTTPAVSVDAAIDDAIDLLLAHGATAPLLVTGPNETPRGVVQTVNLRTVRRVEWGERRVGEIMTPIAGLPRLAATLSVYDAVNEMDELGTELVLIEEEQSAVVPVSRDQLIRGLIERTSVT
jgi:CBS domain-containing protein